MIVVNKEKCVGCRICELICSARHEGVFAPERSRVKIKSKISHANEPMLCRQCDKPLCVEACPSGALSKSDYGAILGDESKCVGYGACVDACPYGAISLDPNKKIPLICDLCNGDPMCVKWCPKNALEFK